MYILLTIYICIYLNCIHFELKQLKTISGNYRVIEYTCPKAFSPCRFSKAREREKYKRELLQTNIKKKNFTKKEPSR